VAPTVPFGQWPSPLRAEDVAAGKVSLSELRSDGRSLRWLESRPTEGGRTVLVRAEGDGRRELVPAGANLRSRVHEYGGGAWCPVPGQGPGPGKEAFAYVDLTEQRVWLSRGEDESPVALSPAPPAGRVWAHGGLGASADGDWVLAVREDHDGAGRQPVRSIVAFGTRPDNRGDSVVVGGRDFYGAPALHPDGERLAFMVWDHPDMPWDSSAVQVLALERVAAPDGGVVNPGGFGRTVDGGRW